MLSSSSSTKVTKRSRSKPVRPTCGCTVADFDREIAPGKTGYIKAKLDTRDFSGPNFKIDPDHDQRPPGHQH